MSKRARVAFLRGMAAAKAGCRTCAAGYGTHSPEELNAAAPDYIIHHPEELMDLV